MTAFGLAQSEKEARLRPVLAELVASHRARCAPYDRILAATAARPGPYQRIADVPWLPVRLFKSHDLRSVDATDVVKVLTSSGTTGEPSRIHLDRAAASAQTAALSRTLRSVLGPVRLPMLIVDSRSIVADRRSYSARGAGVLGLATFGRDHLWLLDHDRAALDDFLRRHGHAPFLVFGFTFLVWQHLRGLDADLSQGILVHAGGWKRLADQAVDAAEFRRGLKASVGLERIHDFYGLVEQIGTVFLEGPSGGSLYCPDFADVVVRDPLTLEEVPTGTPGLLEVVSTLPTSYPGNALLTEDLGVVLGVDDGDWPGRRFRVLGRLPRAEPRGCGDA